MKGTALLKLLKRRLRKGSITLKHKGLSMRPAIKEGYSIVVADEQLSEGDLFVFIKDNSFVCHRLIIKKKDKYFAKGDNKEDPDTVVFKKNILGKVVGILGKNRKAISFPEFNKNKLFLSKAYIRIYFLFKKILSCRTCSVLLRKPLQKFRKAIHKILFS